MGVYKRGGVYWVRFQLKGQEIRRSAGTAVRAEALEFERQIRAEAKRVSRGGRPRHTFRQAMERFVEEHLPTMKPSAAKRYVTSARNLLPHFDGLYLDEIGKEPLSGFVGKRRKGGVAPATINRDLGCLSSMFSCAVSWDWAETNPVKAMDKRGLREPPGRVRFLTKEEFRRLYDAASDHLKPLMLFAVETGCRFEEQFGLRWQHVNLTRREIRLVGTKSAQDRTVPLSDQALAALAACPPRYFSEPWVFHHGQGRRYTTVKRSFATALRRADIKDFRWHDLRHTFASWAVQSGMDLYRLQRWLGHTQAAMTQRYAHLRTDDLHAVIGRVGTLSGTREAV